MAATVAAARSNNGQPCFDVIGVDLDTPLGRPRIASINAGQFPFSCPDPKLAKAIGDAHTLGNLVATSDPAAYRLASTALVDVHLDVRLDEHGAAVADLDGIKAAVRTLGRKLPPGALVIVETTVPPGTCEHVIGPALAAALRDRGLSPDALLLAHSYERVMPGPDYYDSIVNFWRVYAGATDEAAERCRAFLSQVINATEFPLRRLASTTASETAKVLENSFRAVNIAFIDEWARFAETAGIDLFDVIGAVRDRPTHKNIRQPGFGVGGYCLPKDPLLVAAASRQLFKTELQFPFCRLAVETNRQMPLQSLARIEQALGSLDGRRLLMLGVAYRSETDDTRSTAAETFVTTARRRGAKVICHDPYVRHWPELDLAIPAELPSAAEADAVVFAVPHALYRQLDVLRWIGANRPLVYDCDDVLSTASRTALRKSGLMVESTGRGRAL